MNSYNLCEKKSAWYVCYRDYEGKKTSETAEKLPDKTGS